MRWIRSYFLKFEGNIELTEACQNIEIKALEQCLDCDKKSVDFLIKRLNYNYDAGGGGVNSLQPAQRGVSTKGFKSLEALSPKIWTQISTLRMK